MHFVRIVTSLILLLFVARAGVLAQTCCSAPLSLGFSDARTASATPFDGVLGVDGVCSASGEEIVIRTVPGAPGRTDVYVSLASQLTSGRVLGWSLAVAFDGDAILASATTEGTAGALAPDGFRSADLRGFERTELVDPQVNGGQRGVVSSVILSQSRVDPVLPLRGTQSLLKLEVESRPARPGDRDTLVRLRFADRLESSAGTIQNQIDLQGAGRVAACNTATASVDLRFSPPPPLVSPNFIRGDSNTDGHVDVSDAIRSLLWLFAGASAPPCLDAADTDDNGAVNLVDVTFLLDSLLAGQGRIPAPSPGCGLDPTDDGLTSCVYPVTICPRSDDADGDGLTDQAEIAIGTDPNDPDTDSDGVRDDVDSTPAGAPADPEPDGLVMSGGGLTLGDKFGPRDGQHGLNAGDTAETSVAITLPAPVRSSQLKIDVVGPSGSEVFAEVRAVFGRFTSQHDLFLGVCSNEESNPYEPAGSPSPSVHFPSSQPDGLPPRFRDGGAPPFKLNSRRFEHGWKGSRKPSAHHVELVETESWDNFAVQEQVAPPPMTRYVDRPLGEVMIHGLVLRLSATTPDLLDPRELSTGRGVSVDILVDGSLFGRQTLVADPLGPETAGLIQDASVQGTGVHLPDGEVRHTLSLFRARGPGPSVDLRLEYSSYFSNYWRAVAGKSDRDELVYTPFGHGWCGTYTLRLLEETWEEWNNQRPPTVVVPRKGHLALQTAHGRKYAFRERLPDEPGVFDLSVEGMSPTFGVPFDRLVLRKTPQGGYQLGGPLSRVEASFDDEGRLISLRLRDHGRPLAFAYQGDDVVIQDAQGRATRWTLQRGLVTGIEDPAGRRWRLGYAGHSLISVSQVGGIEYHFGYDERSHQLNRVTGPDGTVTSIKYREPGPDSTPRATDLPAFTVERIDEGAGWRTFDYERKGGGDVLLTVEDVLGRTVTHEGSRSVWLTKAAAYSSERRFDNRGVLFEDRTPNDAAVPTRFHDKLPTPGDPAHYLITRYRDGTQTQVNYATNGFWRLDATDEAGNTATYVTTATAKAVGLIEQIVEPATATAPEASTDFVYNDDGELVSVVDAIGVETVFTRSSTRGEIGLALARSRKGGALTSTVIFEYDAMGNVTAQEDPLGARTEFTYTVLDQLATVTHPDGTETVYTRDVAGRVVEIDHPDESSVESTYDPLLGQLETVSTSGGGTTSYLRDALGEVKMVESPRGATVEYVYDGRGLVERVEERPSGRVTRLNRDAIGNVTERRLEATGFADQVLAIEYDDMDRPETVKLPELVSSGVSWNPKVSRSYYPTGRLAEVRREREPGSPGAPPMEEVHGFEYDSRQRLVRTRHGESSSEVMEYEVVYDQVGNPRETLSGKDPAVSTVTRGRKKQLMDLDDLGRPITVKDSSGDVQLRVKQDLAGRITETWRPDSEGNLQLIEERTYDSVKDRLVRVTDAYGTTTLEYNREGLLWRTTDPLDTVAERSYDSRGRLRQIETAAPDGTRVVERRTYTATGEIETKSQIVSGRTHRTSYTYDTEGRVETITNPLGKVTRFTYDARGQLASRVDALGVTTTYRYDEHGNVTRIAYSSGRTIDLEYDAMGRIVSESDANFLREFARDRLGRVSATRTSERVAPFGVHAFDFEYDEYGQLRLVRDPEAVSQSPNGTETRYEYDSENRLQGILRNGDRVARFAYDSAGRLTEWAGVEAGADSGVMRREYDARGKVIRQTGPIGQEIIYEYDSLGRRDGREHVHLGLETRWTYDGVGRLTEELILERNVPRYRDQFAYDEGGNRTRRTKNGVTQSFTYNGFNQLIGQRESRLTPLRAGLTVSADSSRAADHAPGLVLDGASPNTSNAGEAFVSGTSNTEHWLELRLASPATLVALEMWIPAVDNGFPVELHIEYQDDAGNWNEVRALAIRGATLAGAPPILGVAPTAERVFVAFSGTRTDAIRIRQPADGGPPESASRHGRALALTEVRLYTVTILPTESYSYDDNGNLVQAGDRSHAYDEENRLTSVDEPGVADMTLLYGPRGSLLREVDRLAGTEARHVYLHGEIYADYDAVGDLLRKYVHGPLLDQKVGVEPYAGGAARALRRFWPEPNGTIHQITDSGANVLETRITSAWGEPLSLASLGVSDPPTTEFGYTGRRNLGTTGLMDYRARFYDPKLGRFLNPDPSGTLDGLNRYAYVGGDPVNRADPTGLFGSFFEKLDRTIDAYGKYYRMVKETGFWSDESTQASLEASQAANSLSFELMPGGGGAEAGLSAFTTVLDRVLEKGIVDGTLEGGGEVLKGLAIGLIPGKANAEGIGRNLDKDSFLGKLAAVGYVVQLGGETASLAVGGVGAKRFGVARLKSSKNPPPAPPAAPAPARVASPTPAPQGGLWDRLQLRNSRIDQFTGTAVKTRVPLKDAPPGHYLYVVDSQGRVWLGKQGQLGKGTIHHNSLVPAGERARVAGHIRIDPNRTVSANAASGHFMFGSPLFADEAAAFQRAMTRALEAAGFKVKFLSSGFPALPE